MCGINRLARAGSPARQCARFVYPGWEILRQSPGPVHVINNLLGFLAQFRCDLEAIDISDVVRDVGDLVDPRGIETCGADCARPADDLADSHGIVARAAMIVW